LQFNASFHVVADGITNNIFSLILTIEMQANNPFHGICFKTILIFEYPLQRLWSFGERSTITQFIRCFNLRVL